MGPGCTTLVGGATSRRPSRLTAPGLPRPHGSSASASAHHKPRRRSPSLKSSLSTCRRAPPRWPHEGVDRDRRPGVVAPRTPANRPPGIAAPIRPIPGTCSDRRRTGRSSSRPGLSCNITSSIATRASSPARHRPDRRRSIASSSASIAKLSTRDRVSRRYRSLRRTPGRSHPGAAKSSTRRARPETGLRWPRSSPARSSPVP
jgi:hypothetical protein